MKRFAAWFTAQSTVTQVFTVLGGIVAVRVLIPFALEHIGLLIIGIGLAKVLVSQQKRNTRRSSSTSPVRQRRYGDAFEAFAAMNNAQKQAFLDKLPQGMNKSFIDGYQQYQKTDLQKRQAFAKSYLNQIWNEARAQYSQPSGSEQQTRDPRFPQRTPEERRAFHEMMYQRQVEIERAERLEQMGHGHQAHAQQMQFQQSQQQMQFEQMEQFSQWAMDEATKMVTPFEHGGYDMHNGNSWNQPASHDFGNHDNGSSHNFGGGAGGPF